MKEYECLKCTYKTVRKYNFDKHLRSENHIKRHNELNNKNDTYNCNTNNILSNNMVSATSDLKKRLKFW